MEVTSAHQACFELGIKFGSLYHQFVGTPVSDRSVRSLETAIEDAIENQPYCESVSVSIDEAAVEERTTFGYTELAGDLLTVEVDVEVDDIAVTGRMELEDGYPRMRIVSLDN